jgi:prepilin-type N-terminal cleavage/methylation domain-containing protein
MSRHERCDAGFGLIEAIVALAIISLALTQFYVAMGGAYRATARLKVHEAALTLARSHLDALGVDGAIQAGTSSGTYDNGMRWRLTVSALSSKMRQTAPGPRAFWLVLEAFDERGTTLVKLETAKLVRQTP